MTAFQIITRICKLVRMPIWRLSNACFACWQSATIRITRIPAMRMLLHRISSAYKVLGDAEKRASYDARYVALKAEKWKASETSSSRSFENDEHLRKRILSILYIERRNDASSSSVGLWRIEQLIGLPEKILEFHVWYMKEKGWIQRTDTGGYAITAAGVDAVEEGEIILSNDRLLPDHGSSVNQTKFTPKTNSFNSRSQRLITDPV